MTSPLTLLAWALLYAASAAGLVQLVRLLPWVDAQMLAGKKPWVCDLCMSWWSNLLAAGFWVVLSRTCLWLDLELASPTAFVPGFAMTLVFLHVLGSPKSIPDFDPMSLEDMDAHPETLPAPHPDPGFEQRFMDAQKLYTPVERKHPSASRGLADELEPQ